MYNYSLLVDTTERLCIKVGQGQGDRTLGGVCGDLGLGTWGRKMRDLGTSSMGHQDVWDGDMRRQIQGHRGHGDVYCKSRR